MLCKTLSELYGKLGDGMWANEAFKYSDSCYEIKKIKENEFKYGKCYGNEKKLLLFPDSDVLGKDDIVTPLGCSWMVLETENWVELPEKLEKQVTKIDDQIKHLGEFIKYLKQGGELDETKSGPARPINNEIFFDGFAEEELETVYGGVRRNCGLTDYLRNSRTRGIETTSTPKDTILYGFLRVTPWRDYVKRVHFVKNKPSGGTDLGCPYGRMSYTIDGDDMYIYFYNMPHEVGPELGLSFTSVNLGMVFEKHLEKNVRKRMSDSEEK